MPDNPIPGEDLEALALRCEAATGADRRLFCKIIESVVRDISYETQARFLRFVHAEAWLDAAATLVPEGLYPTIDFVSVRCWLRDAKGFDVTDGPAYGCGSTVPLALCAAALRARHLISRETPNAS